MVYETHNGIIVRCNKNCAYFKVFWDILDWNIVRLIWIGFYKNVENQDCVISKLPKDIITHYIFKFVGYHREWIKRKANGNASISL